MMQAIFLKQGEKAEMTGLLVVVHSSVAWLNFVRK